MEEVRILMKLKHVSVYCNDHSYLSFFWFVPLQSCIIGIEDVIDGKDALYIVLEL